MNRKIPPLMWVLVLTSVFLAALGAYLKYAVLKPVDLYQEESIIAIPFMLLSDDTAQYILLSSMEETEPEEIPTQPEQTTPAQTNPSENTVASEPDETTAPVPTEPDETTAPIATEPVPIEIDESWFDDVLFIGDSRTKGMHNFGKLGNANYFSDVGLTIYSIQGARCYITDVGKVNLATLFTKKTYGKIYISLGINEIMGDREKFLEKYQELIDMIREAQPDAAIILQGIMTVGRNKANTKECFTPESIYGLNEEIAALAVGENMYYIDVNEWIADEEGYLPDGWTHDGTHPYASGYVEWAQWILENAGTLGIQ